MKDLWKMDRISATDLRICELHSLAELENVREGWKRLFLNNPSATPFQSWEWNIEMAKFESERVRLRVVVAEDVRGAVVGIAPFWIRSTGLPGLTVLEFIGSRTSDYLDLLFVETYKNVFAQRLLEWVYRNTEWRILNLRNLRRDSVDFLSWNSLFEIRPINICSYVFLPNTLEEYEQNFLQKRLRKTIRHKLNLLGSEKRLRFSISHTPSELLANLPVFLDLHQLRQRAKGERGRFFKERQRNAFKEMSLALARAGLVRLGILWIDGQPAACMYNLRVGDREYGYSSGMAPALAQHNPGNLLEHWMIGEAIKDGMRVYDLLGGSEHHKHRWTNGSCQTFEMMQARTKADAMIWRKMESYRNTVYKSRLLKRLYQATLGRFQGSLLEQKSAS